MRARQTGAKSEVKPPKGFSPIFTGLSFCVFYWFEQVFTSFHRFSPISLFAPGFFAPVCRAPVGSRGRCPGVCVAEELAQFVYIISLSLSLYIYIHIHIRVCIYIYIYIYTCIQVCMYVYVYICICMCIYIYIYIYTCVCVYIYIYI